MKNLANGESRSKTHILVECAILIALSTVLSIFKLVDLPYGGSVTLASMLPLVVLSYRNGLKWGIPSCLVYGVIQQLLGLKNLSYVTGWQSVVAIILLDYVVAFGVIGLAGVFRKVAKEQYVGMASGALLVCVLRYACHVISGCTVWAGLSIPTEAALTYSFIYNATYMVPETIVLIICAVYLGASVDFSRATPVRCKRAIFLGKRGYCNLGAIGFALAALIYDVVEIFANLQNPESGEFWIGGIKDAHWVTIGIVTALCLIVAAILVIAGRKSQEKEIAENETEAAE